MPDKQMDLKRRCPVWEAISELWLDTELQADDFACIAAVLTQLKYSLDELYEIFAFEVAPVVVERRGRLDSFRRRLAGSRSDGLRTAATPENFWARR